MADRILKMIQEINPYEDFDESTLLIEEGILDSLTLVLLIEQLEAEFSVKMPEDALDPDNFASVNRIVEYITSIK